jgi:hypothetical protein
MHIERNGPPATALAQASRAFQGRLENVSLFEILASLAKTRTKGMLFLEGPPPGLIVFDEGQVRTATRGEVSGATALAQLLLLTRGRFQFMAGGESVVDTTGITAEIPAQAPETFGTRALRALDGARNRLFTPRPDSLLEIPRAREATPRPAESPAF